MAEIRTEYLQAKGQRSKLITAVIIDGVDCTQDVRAVVRISHGKDLDQLRRMAVINGPSSDRRMLQELGEIRDEVGDCFALYMLIKEVSKRLGHDVAAGHSNWVPPGVKQAAAEIVADPWMSFKQVPGEPD